MQYKKSGHIASKCNNVKACALPSSHLPLTREARTWCGARDSAGLGGLVRIGNNPSGSRPILLGDSTSPLTREASVVVQSKG